MKPMKFGIGQPIKRVEDARFIAGLGRYTDDIAPRNALYALVLRSPHANASFAITDLAQARALKGVRLILTHADIKHLGDIPCQAALKNSDGKTMKLPPYPLLAEQYVKHVGDAIAFVVADTEAQARLAVETIAVDWQPSAASVDMRKAMLPGAPQVWAEGPGNVAYDMHVGDEAKADAVFAKAAHVVKLSVVNQRLVANYMEPRACIAEFEPKKGRYILTTGSQGVHALKNMLAKDIMKLPADKFQVITPDVGGGFGTKGFMYREYPLALVASEKLRRPVRWTADRSDHFVSCTHGRDNLTDAAMALDASGRFLGLKIDILGGMGSYLSQFAPYIPYLGASIATGPYHIPALHVRVRGVYTHTVPVDAYRGAGRPEAAYVLERLVDNCARALGMPREKIRAKNFIKPAQMPYKTLTDRTYDVGEFEPAMYQSLASADYAGFGRRAKESARRGLLRGIGFASYIECTAWGSGEEGSVSLEKDGSFTALIGTQSNGQGHETAYAQSVSQYLDVPLDRIKVIQGDSDIVKTGNGTGGSRSIPVGTTMLARASEKLVAQLKDLAADKLEAAVADLEISNGSVRIAGTDRAISYADIAALPAATAAKTRAAGEFTPPEATYPNGTHVVEVEIDPDTGATKLLRYTVCDDFGLTLNPLLLAGQVHGGIAQGIGQALHENTVYSAEGQLLSASFMDYGMPRADDLPSYDFETRNVPSVTNPLGLKGAGEAGSIGSTPAVMNAVVDALHRAHGITHIDMPATPSAIFGAIAKAKAAAKK